MLPYRHRRQVQADCEFLGGERAALFEEMHEGAVCPDSYR
jgi:hypothetical protein